MKRMIAFLMACLFLGLCPLALAEETKAGSLTVTGTATVTLEPDYATLHLGVTTQAETMAAAQEQNATQMNALLDVLAGAGVAKEDLQTSHFNVNPVYNYEMQSMSNSSGGSNDIVGFRVENSLQVTVRDLAGIGTLLDTAMQAGANQNYGLNFESSKSAEAYDKALAEAVGEAARKAGLLATASGKQLGDLQHLEESLNYGGGVPYAKNMAMDMAVSTPILSGTLTVSASVQAVYLLK